MATFSETIIEVSAVVKGYHAYKVKPRPGEILQCRREPENSHDSKAVMVVSGDGIMVGHVPSKPVRLCEVFSDFMKKLPQFPIICTVVDKPRASYPPWPSTHQQGGGAVIPCVYKISISTCVATELIKHLKTLEGDKENRLDGYQLIGVQVSRATPKSPARALKLEARGSPKWGDMTP